MNIIQQNQSEIEVSCFTKVPSKDARYNSVFFIPGRFSIISKKNVSQTICCVQNDLLLIQKCVWNETIKNHGKANVFLSFLLCHQVCVVRGDCLHVLQTQEIAQEQCYLTITLNTQSFYVHWNGNVSLDGYRTNELFTMANIFP